MKGTVIVGADRTQIESVMLASSPDGDIVYVYDASPDEPAIVLSLARARTTFLFDEASFAIDGFLIGRGEAEITEPEIGEEYIFMRIEFKPLEGSNGPERQFPGGD